MPKKAGVRKMDELKKGESGPNGILPSDESRAIPGEVSSFEGLLGIDVSGPAYERAIGRLKTGDDFFKLRVGCSVWNETALKRVLGELAKDNPFWEETGERLVVVFMDAVGLGEINRRSGCRTLGDSLMARSISSLKDSASKFGGRIDFCLTGDEMTCLARFPPSFTLADRDEFLVEMVDELKWVEGRTEGNKLPWRMAYLEDQILEALSLAAITRNLNEGDPFRALQKLKSAAEAKWDREEQTKGRPEESYSVGFSLGEALGKEPPILPVVDPEIKAKVAQRSERMHWTERATLPGCYSKEVFIEHLTELPEGEFLLVSSPNMRFANKIYGRVGADAILDNAALSVIWLEIVDEERINNYKIGTKPLLMSKIEEGERLADMEGLERRILDNFEEMRRALLLEVLKRCWEGIDIEKIGEEREREEAQEKLRAIERELIEKYDLIYKESVIIRGNFKRTEEGYFLVRIEGEEIPDEIINMKKVEGKKYRVLPDADVVLDHLLQTHQETEDKEREARRQNGPKLGLDKNKIRQLKIKIKIKR